MSYAETNSESLQWALFLHRRSDGFIWWTGQNCVRTAMPGITVRPHKPAQTVRPVAMPVSLYAML